MGAILYRKAAEEPARPRLRVEQPEIAAGEDVDVGPMDKEALDSRSGRPEQRLRARPGAVGRPEPAIGDEEDAAALRREGGGLRAAGAWIDIADLPRARERAVAAPGLAVAGEEAAGGAAAEEERLPVRSEDRRGVEELPADLDAERVGARAGAVGAPEDAGEVLEPGHGPGGRVHPELRVAVDHPPAAEIGQPLRAAVDAGHPGAAVAERLQETEEDHPAVDREIRVEVGAGVGVEGIGPCLEVGRQMGRPRRRAGGGQGEQKERETTDPVGNSHWETLSKRHAARRLRAATLKKRFLRA